MQSSWTFAKKLIAAASVIAILLTFLSSPARGDSLGDELADWINERGREVWGTPPTACDDLTFARRVYLDLLGRVPSVAEVRDYQAIANDRREQLVNQLAFAESISSPDETASEMRRDAYRRLQAGHLARYWRQVLIPPGTVAAGPTQGLESYLAEQFRGRKPFDEIMRELAQIASPDGAGGYYRLLGGSPESYAGNLSRVMLGIRIDCAQCHDHPFTQWEQGDFWGLAAFYGDLAQPGAGTAKTTGKPGEIDYEGEVYSAKFLWDDKTLEDAGRAPRVRLASWLTSAENPNFSATAVNRFWQMLVGRGLFADIENLDIADEDERAFLDQLGKRFAEDDFHIQRLVAAICKSDWYAAKVGEESSQQQALAAKFRREMKVISPEQVFDSLEQSLHLPISRIDPKAPRWTGARDQMVNRLSEAIGQTPEDYASGIPQALMMMNGEVTSRAIGLDDSRLLRAVVDSPFIDAGQRIETLYLAVLTRQPTEFESESLAKYLADKPNDQQRREALGEILWALLNSPEFVLCR